MNRVHPLPSLCLALVALMLGACGYTWSSRMDGEAARTVALDTVENRTVPHRPGMEYDLTRRLEDEIANDRRLVLKSGAADVRLKVSLTRFTEPTLVEEFETGVRAEVQLLATAEVLAIGDAFPEGRLSRAVSVSVSYTPGIGDTRADGLERLWRDLSREILDVAADTEWAPEKTRP